MKLTINNTNTVLQVSDSIVTPRSLGLVIGTDVQAHSTVLDNTTASFTIAEETKLANMGSSSSVTTSNVAAAGALMDSEVDENIKTLELPANTTVSVFAATILDDADASTTRTTLGLGTVATTDADAYATAAQGSKADSALQSQESHADVLVDGDIGSTVQAYSTVLSNTTASFTIAEETKLANLDGSGSGSGSGSTINNSDGGFANSVYTAPQSINGGTA